VYVGNDIYKQLLLTSDVFLHDFHKLRPTHFNYITLLKNQASQGLIHINSSLISLDLCFIVRCLSCQLHFLTTKDLLSGLTETAILESKSQLRATYSINSLHMHRPRHKDAHPQHAVCVVSQKIISQKDYYGHQLNSG